MSTREGKTLPRNIIAKEKAHQALELRKTGMSYRNIASTLGYNTFQTAHSAVMCAMKAIIKEPAEEVLRLELERLDLLLTPMVVQARNGDQGAIDRVLRIMDRRAKYLGLDAPVKVAPTDPSGQNPYLHMSDEELISEVSAIIANAGAGNGNPDSAEQT